MLADMVVKAATNFAHLGLTVSDIGIPPMNADKKDCSGHSWKNFCMICRFNYCWICGGEVRKAYNGKPVSCWKGVCGNLHAIDTVPSVEHHGRVTALVKAIMGGGASGVTKRNSIVLDSDDDALMGSGGGWDSVRPAPRIQAKAPAARKVPRVEAVVPQINIAPQAVVPQINIAIAPLAQVHVDGVPQTEVSRIADGAMGNARFRVTVTIVIAEMLGPV
jgi:hypothetical protein